jgi:hypothetical protein
MGKTVGAKKRFGVKAGRATYEKDLATQSLN